VILTYKIAQDQNHPGVATKKTGTARDRSVETQQPKEPLLTDFHKVTLVIYFTLLVLLIVVGSIWTSFKILKNMSILFGLDKDTDRNPWDLFFLLVVMFISGFCLLSSSVSGVVYSAECFVEMYQKLTCPVAQPCRSCGTSALME